MKKNSKLTYKKVGVDIKKGDMFVKKISPLARKTFRPEVLSDIGSFGGLFNLDKKKYKNPVLVSGTDGVGTKLKVAFMADMHSTVGIDLVAMCVNDILTNGAEPLFFLDYFATGKLKPEKAAEVIKGISDGCIEAGCSLIGGETAEMPGFYGKGEYDLSGFAVGVVERKKIIDGTKIKKGDAVIGIVSNGLHSNGFSLVRKIFFDQKRMKIKTVLQETGLTLGEELLKPTRIYVKAFNALKNKENLHGMAHITGGGVSGNLLRILPKGLKAVISKNSWPSQPMFEIIKELGNISDTEMENTFNMGIGFVIVVDNTNKEKYINKLRKHGFDTYLIGYTEKGYKGVHYA
jgi:phosphoribosylformylglycinamidine cyclo-ligase